jgi:16S rRNA (guanine527-N7)-methyltransferase
MDKNIQIDTFCRFIRVSRETLEILKKYELLLIKGNQNLNLIGNSTINDIWMRHFLDSAQAIDFIDKNDNVIVDIGSGAGLPGLILAILGKDRKMSLKIKLIEKSPKKIKFLKEVIKVLALDVDIFEKNILKEPAKLLEDVFIARAFKPIKIILELIHNNAKNFKKIIIFMGKNGKNELLEASKIWDIRYKQRVSATSNDSFVIEINKIKKK